MTTVFKLSIAFFVFTLLLSCSKDTEDIGCDQSYICMTIKPEVATLKLDVSLDAENPEVYVEIFRGNINSNLIQTDTLRTSTGQYLLEVGYRYSAKAFYQSGSKTIIAIDQERLNYKTVTNCEIECFEPQTKTLDLRLKTK